MKLARNCFYYAPYQFHSMLRNYAGQLRLRWSLMPAATKGWNPNHFPSVGRALEFAMASKRMKMSWLAQGTRIPIEKLKAVIKKGSDLTSEEIAKVELYVGVPLGRRNTKV